MIFPQHRQNLSRRNHPPVLREPADQRLFTERLLLSAPDHRLIIQLHLSCVQRLFEPGPDIFLQRLPKLPGFPIRPLPARKAGFRNRRGCRLRSSAVLFPVAGIVQPLILVHQCVRPLHTIFQKSRIRAIRTSRRNRKMNRCRSGPECLTFLGKILLRHQLVHHHELVPAGPVYILFPENAGQRIRQIRESPVSLPVAQKIVDPLQTVQIGVHHTAGNPPLPKFRHPFLQRIPVPYPGEQIVMIVELQRIHVAFHTLQQMIHMGRQIIQFPGGLLPDPYAVIPALHLFHAGIHLLQGRQHPPAGYAKHQPHLHHHNQQRSQRDIQQAPHHFPDKKHPVHRSHQPEPPFPFRHAVVHSAMNAGEENPFPELLLGKPRLPQRLTDLLRFLGSGHHIPLPVQRIPPGFLAGHNEAERLGETDPHLLPVGFNLPESCTGVDLLRPFQGIQLHIFPHKENKNRRNQCHQNHGAAHRPAQARFLSAEILLRHTPLLSVLPAAAYSGNPAATGGSRILFSSVRSISSSGCITYSPGTARIPFPRNCVPYLPDFLLSRRRTAAPAAASTSMPPYSPIWFSSPVFGTFAFTCSTGTLTAGFFGLAGLLGLAGLSGFVGFTGLSGLVGFTGLSGFFTSSLVMVMVSPSFLLSGFQKSKNRHRNNEWQLAVSLPCMTDLSQFVRIQRSETL